MRSNAVQPVVSETRSPEDLDRHGKILYEWLEGPRISRVRMLLHWQSAGGLTHVAAVQHRAAACFRYYGNSKHSSKPGSAVSMEEFQEAIKMRHSLGDAGIDTAGDARGDDFRNA